MKKHEFFKQTKPDPKREAEGVWVEYVGGVKLQLRRAGPTNADYKRSLETRMQPYRRRLDIGAKIPEDTQREVLANVYADSIVVNWEGMPDEATGEAQPFTRDNVVKALFTNPDFFKMVQEDAANMAYFQTVEIEEAAKN